MSAERAIKSWLDALAGGACNEAAFLRWVQERFASDTEGGWEVLSQLDQYYRRGRIKAEVFQAVKVALAESALGAGHSLGIPVVGNGASPRSAARAEPDPPPRREEVQPQDAVLELKPGSVLRRRYRIETMLGQGSMGAIFQAIDEYRLDTPPAGQRLAIRVAHAAVTKRAELLTELRRSFQQMQRLSHPNIVRVFEFDRDGPIVFFTMELLNGALLSRVLQAGKVAPLSLAQAWAVIRDIGGALAHAHSRGVVHGDVNPQNVFITISGELRVLDFAAPLRSNPASAAADHELTLPSAASGYASCQVLEGERADARDDVFALACIAFELLRGEHPFPKKTAIEARKAGLNPPRPPKLTHQQWQALRAGLAWDREERPSDIRQWLQKLDLRGAAKQVAPIAELLEPLPHKERKSRLSMSAAAAIALLLAAGYWVISQRGMLPRVDDVMTASAPSSAAPGPAPPAAAPANSAPTSLGDRPPPPVRAVPPPAAHEAPASHDALPVREASAAREGRVARDATAAHQTGATAPATPTAAAPPARAPSATPAPTSSAAPASSPGTSSGASRIELAADTVDVPAAESSAEVTVRRKGSLRGEAIFTWWTESGTAKPGIDFSAVVPHQASIGDGKSSISLSIPVSKARRAQAKSFYVVIDHIEGGAPLAGRTLTMVTLTPAE
ncbi:MAG TPA: protein kinase [Steroidobacteraceae bacterium]|nr:protein kinase [Steroidobacteraceae bacterium]